MKNTYITLILKFVWCKMQNKENGSEEKSISFPAKMFSKLNCFLGITYAVFSRIIEGFVV